MPQWIRACATDDIDEEDLIRFDGLVMGHLIECPKHNGQFDYRTGEAKRTPACVNLRTYPVKVDGGDVFIEVP
jgi:3-phenylpropionate/trans-cinnamate dioxygenase ferredoxin subunit